MQKRYASSAELIAAHPIAQKRSEMFPGFEGFAPDDAIFDPQTELWERLSFERLAAFIAELILERNPNPRILELGCGPAHLFYFFQAFGIANYIGIDGNPFLYRFNELIASHREHFLNLNLQEEIRLIEHGGRMKFDLICCFEVLEHLREEYIDNLIRTITNHMHSTSLVLCTASLQADLDVHVTVKNRQWWLDKFARGGLVPDKDSERICAQLAKNHPFNWSPDNTNIFHLTAAPSFSETLDTAGII